MNDEMSITIHQAIVLPDIIIKNFREGAQLGVFVGNEVSGMRCSMCSSMAAMSLGRDLNDLWMC